MIPQELADELYERLSKYYEDDPNVKVIVDRRAGERRTGRSGGGARTERDRRRKRIPGEFPPIEVPE